MVRAAPPPGRNMGTPEPRIEARQKVTGAARYASDMPVNRPAFAFLITSTIAKGKITDLDTREAKAVPGVLEIFVGSSSADVAQAGSVTVTPGPPGAGPAKAFDGSVSAV